MWQQTERYPDPRVISLDPSFDKYRVNFSAVERLATGFRFTEGPVYFGDARCVLFSDIPNSRILRWDEETGAVSVYRAQSNYANGNTRDRQGRLITCEHGRRITRTEYDGRVTVLMDSFDGKPLNSPNDVVVRSDESIWFTDPPMGIWGHYEGDKAEPQLPHSIYRIDGKTGKASLVTADLKGPNGLCFSPDEKLLYVTESRGVPNKLIHCYEVSDDRREIGRGKVFYDAGAGTVDGIRVDVDGNLWCGWGMGSEELDGVMVLSPAGKLIGRIALPERCANICFGGPKRNRLFMAASQSLYAVHLNTQGVAGG